MNPLNKAISVALPFVPKSIIGYFSKAYIAGERIDDAVQTVKALMAEGACATIDVLGEEITYEEQALHATEIYKQVLQKINSEQLDANISLKPTHLGLKLNKNLCYKNILALVEHAKMYSNFVRVDMEDHTTTSDTINIYRELRKEFDNVGTVLQAYLRRTIDDVNQLIPINPNLRICKGIYIEPYQIAYKDRDIIVNNFAYILEKFFINNCYIGIATHDEKVVWEAMRLLDKYNIKKDRYEFQMLLGVDLRMRKRILAAGHRLRVYVPFGAEWAQYSIRRLKENPHIVGHVTRHLIRNMFKKNDE